MNCKKRAVEMQNRPREFRAGGSLTGYMMQDASFVKGGGTFLSTIPPERAVQTKGGA
jgi:hypothetical protein